MSMGDANSRHVKQASQLHTHWVIADLTNTLRDAATAGKLLTKEDYHREVTRLLEDDSYYRGAIGHAWGSRDKIPPRLTSHPRIVRFFREFFGYPAALKIFKDLKRSDGFYINPGRGSNQTPGSSRERGRSRRRWHC